MYKKFVISFFLFTSLLFGDELKEITLQLKWKYQFQFAGFIMAKEKGFYNEAGLNIKFKEFDPSITVIDEVLSGKSTFGIDDSQLLYYRLQGKPLVGLMGIFQSSPVVLLGLKESGFKDIKDLDGKRLELTHNSNNSISTKALLRAFNIQTKQYDVTFKLDNLINKKVDVIVAYDANEPYHLKKLGYEPQVFSPIDYGFNFYGDILFTTERILKQNPEMVKNFHDASKKGWKYAFNNIDETINVILSKYNSQNRTYDALKFEADTLKKHANFHENFSHLNQDRIESIAKSFAILFPSRYDLNVLNDFIYKGNESFQQDYTLIKQIIGIFLAIISLTFIWIKYLKAHNLELKITKEKLHQLNQNLEERVAFEVEKNREQELILSQQSRLAQMGETINMIAHQWKQPLNHINSIVLNIDLKLASQKLPHTIVLDKELHEIENSTLFMSNTITDFRNFFKPEKEKQYFDIKETIEYALRLIQPILEHEHVEIHTDYTHQASLYGYKNEFGHVIINLLKNAHDALMINKKEKQKNIYISLHKSTEKIKVIIRDDGGGIDEKIIKKIFKPYFSTKEHHGGTGIGLYMSKVIIEDHMHGTISVENDKEGALFTLTFLMD